MQELRIGAHVDKADPVGAAIARGANVAQFFLGDPQGWKGPVVEYAGGAAELTTAASDADIDLYVHAPYVLNVATTNNRIRIPSRKLLQQHVDLAAQIGAKGLVVHGGHVLKDDDPETGIDNWRKCAERTDLKLPVFIENTAGGTNAMARELDRIARLWDAVGEFGLGFCLDTCHAHAGGIDLSTAVDQVKRVTGRIDLVHANDSNDAFDSGADRHVSIGQGVIGAEAIAAIARESGAPVIVETPADGQAADIELLRSLIS